MNKLVDIKIRPEYRDMLKAYCQKNGFKMYAFVENLIKKNCSVDKPTNTLKSKPTKKQLLS